MTEEQVPPAEKGVDQEERWKASILSGSVAPPLAETTRAELRRVRAELQLGHDDAAANALDPIVRRLGTSPGDGDAGAGGDEHAIRGSALVCLARVRTRAGEGGAASDLYMQALSAFAQADSEGQQVRGVEALEWALAAAARLRSAAEVDSALRAGDAVDADAPGVSDLMVDLGDALLRSGSSRSAVEVLRRAAAADARPHVLTTLAEALVAVGEAEEAVEKHVASGVALGTVGRFEKAVQSFDAALGLRADHVEALTFRAEALRQTGRPAEALASIEAALHRDPGHVDALKIRALALFDLGRSEEAVAALESIAASAPEDAHVSLLLATALAEVGRVEDALVAAQHAADLDPTGRNAQLVLVHLLRTLGRPDDALSAVDRALATEPLYPEALRARAEVLHGLGRFAEALETIERALELDPQDAGLMALRGEYLRLLGRSEESIEVLRRALEIEPDSAWTLGTLGQALLAAQRREEGKAALEKAIALSPSLTWAWDGLIEMLFSERDYDGALAVVNRAPHGDSSAMTVKKAQLLLLAGRYEEAVDVFRAAIAAHETPQLQVGLGTCLFELGRFQEALEAFERAVAADPDGGYPAGGLGRTLVRLGRVDEGVAALRDAAAQQRDYPLLLSVVKGLIEAEHFEEALELLIEVETTSETRDASLASLTSLIEAAPTERLEQLVTRIREVPDWNVGQLIIAYRLRDAGSWKGALDAVDRALASSEDWLAALMTKAVLLEIVERDEELEPVLQLLRRLAPNDVEVAALDARRLRRAGRVEEAEQVLRTLAEHHPGPEPFERLADLLRLDARHDEALEALDAAGERGFRGAYWHGTRGQSLSALGRAEEALVDLRIAHDLAPELDWVTNVLIGELRGSQRYAEAAEIAEAAAARPKATPVVHGIAAAVVFDIGEFERALAHCNSATGISEDTDWLISLRGWIHLVLRDGESALKDFEIACAREGSTLDDRRGRAEALLLLSHDDDARKLFEELLADARQAPESATVDGLEVIGWSLVRLGRYREAVETYAEALAIDSLSVGNQLDLALATLCTGNARAAKSEYGRGVEVAMRNEGLRARSRLRFALRDFDDVTGRLDGPTASAEGEEIKRLLSTALDEIDRRYEEERGSPPGI